MGHVIYPGTGLRLIRLGEGGGTNLPRELLSQVDWVRKMGHQLFLDTRLLNPLASDQEYRDYKIRPDGGEEVSAVTLILDIGNTRTAGLLVEGEAGSARCERLRLVDYWGQDGRWDTDGEAVDSFVAVELEPAEFDGDEDKGAFCPTSHLRLGTAARKIVRDVPASRRRFCSMVSPKRSFWKEKTGIRAAVRRETNSQGKQVGAYVEGLNVLSPSVQPQLGTSGKAFLGGMVLELLEQAEMQVASWADEGDGKERRIRKMIVTYPPAWTKGLKARYEECIQAALKDWCAWRHYNEIKLEVNIDEAAGGFLTYLNSELEKQNSPINVLRRNSGSCTIAVLDIGGGTSDVSCHRVAFLRGGAGRSDTVDIQCTYSNGVSFAGDDLLRYAAEHVVLPGIMAELLSVDAWGGEKAAETSRLLPRLMGTEPEFCAEVLFPIGVQWLLEERYAAPECVASFENWWEDRFLLETEGGGLRSDLAGHVDGDARRNDSRKILENILFFLGEDERKRLVKAAFGNRLDMLFQQCRAADIVLVIGKTTGFAGVRHWIQDKLKGTSQDDIIYLEREPLMDYGGQNGWGGILRRNGVITSKDQLADVKFANLVGIAEREMRLAAGVIQPCSSDVEYQWHWNSTSIARGFDEDNALPTSGELTLLDSVRDDGRDFGYLYRKSPKGQPMLMYHVRLRDGVKWSVPLIGRGVEFGFRDHRGDLSIQCVRYVEGPVLDAEGHLRPVEPGDFELELQMEDSCGGFWLDTGNLGVADWCEWIQAHKPGVAKGKKSDMPTHNAEGYADRSARGDEGTIGDVSEDDAQAKPISHDASFADPWEDEDIPF